jgi:hypothetical protein
VLAFRNAAWLPNPPPPLPVKFIEINDHGSGRWGGNCVAMSVYSIRWPIACIAPRFRDLMEWQIVVELAGGICEAAHRGERRGREVLAFAESNCSIDADLTKAAAVGSASTRNRSLNAHWRCWRRTGAPSRHGRRP